MSLSQKYRRSCAALLCGLLLMLPAQALALQPDYIIYEMLSVTQSPVTVKPLYLEQLSKFEAQKQALKEEPAVTEHCVLKGETLSSIAKKYGTTVAELVQLNNLRNANFIREGQILVLVAKPAPPVVHSLKSGETVWDLARRYSVSMDEIIKTNSISDPRYLQPGQNLVIPGATAPVATVSVVERELVVASRSAPRTAPEPFDCIWPIQGKITSGYGPRWGSFHYAIDIAARTGTPIKAAAAGTVVESGWRTGYGYMVRIDHGNGWESLYAHASKLHVNAGTPVSTGQTIAAVGQTGNATGPHLHLEFLWQGLNVNPLKYLP